MNDIALNSLLKDSSTNNVWNIFHKISQIPRKSMNEVRVVQMLEEFAKSKGFDVKRDKFNNLLITAPSKTSDKWLAMQGHIDMVCVKNESSNHNFDEDPIEWVLNDDILSASGTTLGADNGIGCSMALASAIDFENRPNLEILITTDEEVGMVGANSVAFDLKSKMMLNIDTEEEGILYTGCAGGAKLEMHKVLKTESVSKGYKLTLSGFLGGHSGIEIHENKRKSAIQIAARILLELKDIRVSSINGGEASNSIPKNAVVLFSSSTAKAQIINAIEKIQKQIPFESELSDESNLGLISNDDSLLMLNLINAIPQGVVQVSNEVPNLVQTSNNLGIIKSDKNRVSIICMPRSSSDLELSYILSKLKSISHLAGFNFDVSDPYPGWQPDSSSKLLQLGKDVYFEINNKYPDVTAIHAGLECGILKGKYPDVDFISFGPNIRGAHTPEENVSVNSVKNTYAYLKMLLEKLA